MFDDINRNKLIRLDNNSITISLNIIRTTTKQLFDYDLLTKEYMDFIHRIINIIDENKSKLYNLYRPYLRTYYIYEIYEIYNQFNNYEIPKFDYYINLITRIIDKISTYPFNTLHHTPHFIHLINNTNNRDIIYINKWEKMNKLQLSLLNIITITGRLKSMYDDINYMDMNNYLKY